MACCMALDAPRWAWQSKECIEKERIYRFSVVGMYMWTRYNFNNKYMSTRKYVFPSNLKGKRSPSGMFVSNCYYFHLWGVRTQSVESAYRMSASANLF